VGRLGRDDAGRLGAEILQPHRKAAGIERVEFHEAGPGLVEQNIVAERADLLENHFSVVDRAVISALFDHGDAERSLALPGLLIFNERIGADLLTDRSFIERLVVLDSQKIDTLLVIPL